MFPLSFNPFEKKHITLTKEYQLIVIIRGII